MNDQASASLISIGTIVSRHFTEKGARKKAAELNKNRLSPNRRSSGWSRVDYTVIRIHNAIRGWGVRPREIRS